MPTTVAVGLKKILSRLNPAREDDQQALELAQESGDDEPRAMVMPFVKRDQFSHQKEYRFTVSIRGEPKEPKFFLPISTGLRHLAKIEKQPRLALAQS